MFSFSLFFTISTISNTRDGPAIDGTLPQTPLNRIPIPIPTRATIDTGDPAASPAGTGETDDVVTDADHQMSRMEPNLIQVTSPNSSLNQLAISVLMRNVWILGFVSARFASLWLDVRGHV